MGNTVVTAILSRGRIFSQTFASFDAELYLQAGSVVRTTDKTLLAVITGAAISHY
jgi:hypothetical protein